MSSEFTYKAPDERQFMRGLVAFLESKGCDQIVSVLSDAKCSINNTGDYAYYRGGKTYNAYATIVTFEIPSEDFAITVKKLSADDKKTIKETCQELMPKETGLEITSIAFKPLIGEPDTAIVEGPKPFIKFVNYETDDALLNEHIKEINKTYRAECYTATFMLCRKVLENLIIHSIIKKKYPDKSKEHREKYYDFANNRNLDFSVLLSNLRRSSAEFAPDNKLVDRICQLADGFKEDANEMTHSLYHIATKKELDDKGFQNILVLIKRLEQELDKPKTA